MDAADFCLAGEITLNPQETFPPIIGMTFFLLIHFEQHRLGTMSQIFQHFAHATFKIEAHNDKLTLRVFCAFKGWRITPERIGSTHDTLVIATIGMPE